MVKTSTLSAACLTAAVFSLNTAPILKMTVPSRHKHMGQRGPALITMKWLYWSDRHEKGIYWSSRQTKQNKISKCRITTLPPVMVSGRQSYLNLLSKMSPVTYTPSRYFHLCGLDRTRIISATWKTLSKKGEINLKDLCLIFWTWQQLTMFYVKM